MEFFSSLQEKEVINIRDGFRMGYVSDIEINKETGLVVNLIVTNSCKILGLFGSNESFIIDWCCIKKIGSDIILVDVHTEKVLIC